MKLHFSLLLLMTILLQTACTTQQKLKQSIQDPFQFTVAPAPEWDSVFYRDKGWFGGDGIFSVSLHGNEPKQAGKTDSVLMWFSDTMIGEITDSLLPGETMVNNTLAVLPGTRPDRSAIRFYWNEDDKHNPSSIFIPRTKQSVAGEYYWLGDGFVDRSIKPSIYIFGYRITNIPGKAVFGFKETGNSLIRIPASAKPPFETNTQVDIPFFTNLDRDSTGSFGAALLVNTKDRSVPHPDGYLYIYGVRGKAKEVIVARVKPGHIEEMSAWRFWNGKSWTADISGIRPIADRSSNEMSVTALQDGRYIMIFQKDAIGRQVALRVGTSPVGPFGPITDVYDVSGDLRDSPNLISYNAKAHPVLSKPGQLLISYNINSFDFAHDIRKYPHLYRPRFIWLKYK